MTRRLSLATILLASFLLASPAFAAPQTHDGFFLRLGTGLSYASTSEKVNDVSFGIAGLGTMGGLSLGWSIVENLALHLDIAGVRMLEPKVSLTSGGTTISKDVTAEEFIANVGVGVSYYIMPANIYVGGAAHVSQLSLTTSTNSVDSGTGWGFSLNAGKEWWVSDNWGIGAAGQFVFSAAPDKGANASTLYTPAFGILFSATYN